MQTRAVLNNGDTINYALGQSLFLYKGLKAAGHGGADAGYRTQIMRLPGQRFSVIVFSNLASFNPSAMANKIADLYLADEWPAKAPGEELPAEVSEDKEPETEVTGISMDADTLMAYVGDYELQPGFIVKISMKGEDLIAQAAGLEDVVLRPKSTVEFEVAGADARLSFHRDSSGQVSLMKFYQGDQVVNAPKLAPFDPEGLDLSEFTGAYYSDELSTRYEFIIEDGNLVARHQRNSDIKLTPVKEDVFSGDAWFFGQTEFVRDGTRAITGCNVSSGRVRNLYFRKMD
jgi:hypothetical protein